ncbi:hypothetical protein [Deinococcus multiflagellatus]|uniref:Uncharacterized protein n=1 Tax=Deinococcus multiflagellatus TaxID=1656887 RepID=A0ABW1ZPR9_9DEIO|nr:hypothetical protein [Deinococcus multiflagellatus]MBZ9715303.1 hypothetical protein [Deinococcus multiflagellatus]
MTGPLRADIALLADGNPARPSDRHRAGKAAQRLLAACTNVERAQVLAFVHGHQSRLGLQQPTWLYQMAGLLMARSTGTVPERAAYVLGTLRARLIVALGLRARGAR